MKPLVMKFRTAKTRVLASVICAGLTAGVSAFSLLGPESSWQVPALGYGFAGDIGGPMNLGEGFRWNVPQITYACDASFINYFGPEVVKAIDEAMDVFNKLDAPSKISADLSEYSLDTLREHPEASLLGIVDLKSSAIHLVMEELGFADPIRFCFTLRARETDGPPPVTNYITIQRNFDPDTLQNSRYVNGVLYGYSIQEFQQPVQHADAIEEIRVAGDAANIPAASGFGFSGVTGGTIAFGSGLYRTGLTRDDVAAIRYLYHPHNYAVDTLLPGIAIGGNLSPFSPFLGTNVLTTTNTVVGGTGTNIVATGLRGGRNKLKFRKAMFDPLLSNFFTTRTSQFTDVVVSSNRTLVVQPLVRQIVQPDIIFSAGDLGLIQGFTPAVATRTDTTAWVNNDALNGFDPVDEDMGPGTIVPQVQITFNTIFPAFFNSNGGLSDLPTEETGFSFGVWGSFDGSTNAPVIYPKARNLSINQLRNIVLGRGALPQ
jgi:hypothetical protein